MNPITNKELDELERDLNERHKLTCGQPCQIEHELRLIATIREEQRLLETLAAYNPFCQEGACHWCQQQGRHSKLCDYAKARAHLKKVR